MTPRTSRFLATAMLFAGLLAAAPAAAAKLSPAAKTDSLPSLDDLAGPASTRFT